MPNLRKEQVLLAALALADGKYLTPVQIQKALFLADDKIKDAFARNSRYDFQPYDYGPFDQNIYRDAEALSINGFVEIGRDSRGGWKTYAATEEGLRRGQELLAKLTPEQRAMLARIVSLVRRLSFTELVSAIYRGYDPKWKARSVFRD